MGSSPNGRFCGCVDANYQRGKTLNNSLINHIESSEEISREEDVFEVVDFIESYDANNNFFYYIKNITKIQSVFRGYKFRKQFKIKKSAQTNQNSPKKSQNISSFFNPDHKNKYSDKNKSNLEKNLTRSSFEFNAFKNDYNKMDLSLKISYENTLQHIERFDDLSPSSFIYKSQKVSPTSKTPQFNAISKSSSNIPKSTREGEKENEKEKDNAKEKEKETTFNEQQEDNTLAQHVYQTQTSFLTKTGNRSNFGTGKYVEVEHRGCFTKKKSHYTYQGNIHPKTKKKTGFGKITWDDSSILLANFDGNQINGIAFYDDKQNQSEFSGEYKNNRPNGFGVYKCEGVILEGEWNNNVLDGIGYEYSDNDTYYQGNYKNCQKEGIGMFRWSDGTIYKGEFVENTMHGYGMVNYNDDDRMYIGQIENGVMNGYGEFYWGKGVKRYMGFYYKDFKQGFGIYVDSIDPLSGYIGFWDKGKMNGIGIKVVKGEFMYGIWKAGKVEIWLQGPWEMIKYAKRSQIPAVKFMERKPSKLSKYIGKLMDYKEI